MCSQAYVVRPIMNKTFFLALFPKQYSIITIYIVLGIVNNLEMI